MSPRSLSSAEETEGVSSTCAAFRLSENARCKTFSLMPSAVWIFDLARSGKSMPAMRLAWPGSSPGIDRLDPSAQTRRSPQAGAIVAWMAVNPFPVFKNGRKPPTPTLDHLERLLNWLAATGDFDQRSSGCALAHFLATGDQNKPPRSATVIALATWFESPVKRHWPLHPQVDRFLTDTLPNYRWREDAIFCGRRRVEYH